MDIISPGKSPADPTSRPVIIPHRSMMQADPMLTPESDESSGGETSSGHPFKAHDSVNTTDEASGETTDDSPETVPESSLDSSDLPSAPPVKTAAAHKKIEPVFSVEKQDESLSGEGTDSVSAAPNTEDAQHEEALPEAEQAAKTQRSTGASHTPLKEAAKETQHAADESKADGEATDDKAVASQSVKASDDEPAAQDSTEEVSSEKTAEQARLEQLEALAAEGTYHVRISDDDSRNTRWLFILLLCIVLALVALNVLLDLELLELPGVPHTNLLG